MGMRTVHRFWFGVFAAAFALVVLPGQALAGNATNINVTLPVARASISGTITRHGGGAVTGAMVYLVRPGENFPSAVAFADASGTFTFFDLGSGDFTVAVNPQVNAPTYMPGFYLKTSSPDHITSFQASATTLHYTGTAIGNVNMAVQVGHSISGRIRAATSLAPLNGVTVSATLDPSSGSTPFSTISTTTNAAGNYAVSGLPKGKFSLKADPNAGIFVATRVNFGAGCFVNAPPHNYTANCASSTQISVNNVSVAGKNLDLPSGHRITGMLKDAQGHNLCASITASDSSFAISPPTSTSCGAFAIVGLGAVGRQAGTGQEGGQ
jgi:Carboxypeptidase regulatory-like domain